MLAELQVYAVFFGYLVVWLGGCLVGWLVLTTIRDQMTDLNNKRPNQTTKYQNNKKQLELCSPIRNFELRSKLLPLDNSQSKTSFYLELCSLIRNFVP